MSNKNNPYDYRAYLGMKLWQKLALTTVVLAWMSILIAYINPVLDFDMSKILSSSSTLFSILVGFFIASAMANFLRLKTLISTEIGALYSIYKFSTLMSKSLGKEVKDAIDKYVTSSFDWELENYVENTQKEFEKISDIFASKNANPKGAKEQQILNSLMNNISILPATRNEISIVAKTTLNTLYWSLLIILAGLTVFAVLMGTQFTLVSITLAVSISAAVVFALFLLDEIDRNKLNEYDISFNNFNLLLVNLGKLPYYLETDIKSGRVKPDLTKPYRLCKYKDFPNSLEKSITIVNPKRK